MEVKKTDIEGVVILEPRLFEDERGYFFEAFSEREFAEKVRECHFVQENEAYSTYGVVRGLHFQRPPHAQRSNTSLKRITLTSLTPNSIFQLIGRLPKYTSA